MSKEIPISEAEMIAEKYGYEQVVILSLSKSKEKENYYNGWRTTYNKDKRNCQFLGKVADIIAYNFRCYYASKTTTHRHHKILKKEIEKYAGEGEEV